MRAAGTKVEGRHSERMPAFKTYVDCGLICVVQSGRRDLNPRPLPPQGSALPDCATPRSDHTGAAILAAMVPLSKGWITRTHAW